MSKVTLAAIILAATTLYGTEALAVSKSLPMVGRANNEMAIAAKKNLSVLVPKVIERNADQIEMQALELMVDESAAQQELSDRRESNTSSAPHSLLQPAFEK